MDNEKILLMGEKLQFCMDCQYLGRDWHESDEHIGTDGVEEFRERLCPKCHSLAYVMASAEERGELMIENMTVKNVRYFETSRGVGYEAETNEGSIWNDGIGGATYFRPKYPEYTNQDFGDFIYDELKLESLIDKYEVKNG